MSIFRCKILGVLGSSGDEKDESKDDADSYRPCHYTTGVPSAPARFWPYNTLLELAHKMIPTEHVENRVLGMQSPKRSAGFVHLQEAGGVRSARACRRLVAGRGVSPDANAPTSPVCLWRAQRCTPLVWHAVATRRVSLLLALCFPCPETPKQRELFIFKCRGSRYGLLSSRQTVTDAQHCCWCPGVTFHAQQLTAEMANIPLLLMASWWKKSSFKGFGLIIWTQALFLSSSI